MQIETIIYLLHQQAWHLFIYRALDCYKSSYKIQLKTLRSISYYKYSHCFVSLFRMVSLAGSVLLVTTNSFIRQICHAAKLCPNIYVSSTHLGQLVVYSKCSFCPAIPSLQERRKVRKFGGGGQSPKIEVIKTQLLICISYPRILRMLKSSKKYLEVV